MLLVVAVIAGGVLVGLAFGGSLRNLAEVQLRWWPLAVAGFVLQLIPVPSRPGQVDHWIAVGLLLASYAVLLVFVGANLRRPGFPLIAVGFALNLLVIGVNGGMPVKDQALRQAAGSRYERSRQTLLEKGGAKHHLATSEDVLVQLSDVIGIGDPVRNVFSPGDLLSYAGVAWALSELTRRPARRHRAGPDPPTVRQARTDGPRPADPDQDVPRQRPAPDPALPPPGP